MHNPPLILVADDDIGFQEILATKLKRSGFLVAEAHNGKEAVEKAVNLTPDLILCDINMPGETGTEVVLDLMKGNETKGIKVLLITSMDNPWPAIKEKNENFAKEIGATDFINKSTDLDSVIEKVKEVIK
ncbi:MAG: hypothetical protein COU07_04030 [Candidatus Harrisonbacteria bacterium CG10_big_fil_rev_8_21_14_0_10_40_38]|uniref:Response regulatory domain-containing protein n=1 Tax=Candidatus Harrisonbacteria bacterium CG10_big_fil_rev_8_21_14_0_10_40_38 TaxID=1974583 RepID=A0A2H0UR54_9BACT|nr:MAG: hypothetical protein COU07_04030 [Candidatus Harrisonbacteria bacterium CG10_big_fil_rev_8_21_14_0_10_40_38]